MIPAQPFDEIWETQKNALKAKKIKLQWKTKIKKAEPQIPKRFTSIKEIWKYYFKHASYHGVYYWLDTKLHPVERVILTLAFMIGLGWAIKIIFEIYGEFKLRKSNIVIDEINTDIERVPFPSITVCPTTRVNWIKALEIAEMLIPKGNENAKQQFLYLLDTVSEFSVSRWPDLQTNNNDPAVLNILKGINMTDVMIKVLPKCEEFIFNCSWNFNHESCCEIFDLQRTSSGFCYSFNSLTSERSRKEFLRAETYGIRSGLRFSTVKTNRSHLPPSMTALEYNSPMAIMISDVRILPVRSRVFAYGYRYYVSLKFICSNATDEILALENDANPPCKYDNGYYKFENCIANCFAEYVVKNCGCIPFLYFQPVAEFRYPECNMYAIRCIRNATIGFSSSDKNNCLCYAECEYFDYNDFTGAIPDSYENQLVTDVYFDGPTGVCYSRKRVHTTLDMLAQFGGIFGLFVGGSVISVAEILYNIILTMAYIVYSCFKKKQKKNILPAIEVKF